jgi:uncharacterized protein (TIGR02646 family)
MIEVKRLPKPHVLRRNAARWRQDLLTAATKRDRKRAELRYRHREVKGELVRMFHGKCAYCESRITHLDYGHIEHYKPKSRYPRLTFTWTNLLLACGVCNGAEHKGDRFPARKEGGPLLDPCRDRPSDHLTFHYDPVTKLASVYGRTQRGTITERLLGLNRPELRSYRSQVVRRLLVLGQLAPTDPEARAILAEAKGDAAEYAAFARVLLP